MAGDISHEQAAAAVSTLREVTKLEVHTLKLASFANMKVNSAMLEFCGLEKSSKA